ncbi:MAG TPA: CinA family protein [Candidatus Hydrogenedentes bacterium]|nr:CinA family protein [Candidatus Hydrogenedentota bacterium]
MTSAGALEHIIGERLEARKLTLAVAESCSGGLIAHRITNVPGASAYFLGGVVAYANDAKTRVLGVPAEHIAAHGAVSEHVAKQMAEGVRRLFTAHIGLGVTGIAGPGGGTAGKPVGLVYVACAKANQTWAIRNEFSGTREEVKRQTAEAALRVLMECIS